MKGDRSGGPFHFAIFQTRIRIWYTRIIMNKLGYLGFLGFLGFLGAMGDNPGLFGLFGLFALFSLFWVNK